ncbi:methyltransferase like 5 [Pseudohyphozyma bogoriensis]|nr:methyltransferase like 5 [Pseudohyphozyma bogoriensis]
MKLKELESELQPLKGFAAPKRELEQYVTNPHLASRMIFNAESGFGDIDEKDILDLGCGCAVLSIACVMLGANSVLSVDADPDALAIAKENIASLEMEENIDLINAVIPNPGAELKTASASTEATAALTAGVPIFDYENLDRTFDTVVMNPPFGTWNAGIDMVFLEIACKLAGTAVYSLHKSSTRDYILKKAKSLGFTGEVLAQMKYALPKTMAFHKAKTLDIEVDFFRFSRD